MKEIYFNDKLISRIGEVHIDTENQYRCIAYIYCDNVLLALNAVDWFAVRKTSKRGRGRAGPSKTKFIKIVHMH